MMDLYQKKTNILKKGNCLLDRYGGWFDESGNFHDSGKYFAKKNVSFKKRALPANYKNEKPLKSYEILKDLPVLEGASIPWFKQPGKGIQFQTLYTVEELIEKGYIKPIN